MIFREIPLTGAILEIQRPVNSRIGFPLIHMDIVDSIGGKKDAGAIVELELSELREEADDLQVVHDSGITIDGVDARRIDYSLPGEEGDLYFGALVIFSRGGVVWHMDLLNHEEGEKQEYDSLLDHMIATFRFLD